MISKEIYFFFKSIRIYFTSDMLKLMLLPLILSIVVFYIGFFVLASNVVQDFKNYQVQIETHNISNNEVGFQEENNSSLFSFDSETFFNTLITSSITSWIAGILFYTFGLVVMGYVAIFTSLIIIGFLTPRILALIHSKNYNNLNIEEGYGNISNTILFFVKTILVMIILFIGLIPFYFIPILNIFIMFIPFYYFFHKMINFDVTSTIMSKEQFLIIYEKNKTNIRIKTLFLYFISLIPFVAFFIAIFYIIYIGITYFEILNVLDKQEKQKNTFELINE